MTWDKNVDYDIARESLLKLLKEARIKVRAGNKKARARLTIILILLTQLRNGARLGESYEAVYKFAETKAREVYVRLEKQKRYEERLMVLPEDVTPEDLSYVVRVNRDSVYTFARRILGINTHSLRYAFVTRLSKMGYPPNIIAKITGHKNLNHLITYTQAKKGEEILRALSL